MIEIKRWDNDNVIHSGYFASVKECLEDGVKHGVSFNDAKLNDAKLNDAKLNGAILNRAELNGAILNYAILNGAILNRAELNGAILNYAELNGAILNGAILNYAELNGAILNYAKLNGAELNGAELPIGSVCICSGEEYWLFISPDVVQAGCKSHTPDEWRNFTSKEIAKMDGKRALKFYPRLIELIDFFIGSNGE